MICALVTWKTLQAQVTTKSKALPGIETRRLEHCLQVEFLVQLLKVVYRRYQLLQRCLQEQSLILKRQTSASVDPICSLFMAIHGVTKAPIESPLRARQPVWTSIAIAGPGSSR